MSGAAKCDRCGDLFEHKHGTVILARVEVQDRGGEKFTTWDDVEFCPGCSQALLDVISPALQSLKRPKRIKT